MPDWSLAIWCGSDGDARHRSDCGHDFALRDRRPVALSNPALMAFLGLVASEDSTGDRIRRGPITKTGNWRARRTLVECSWSYRHPPRVGRDKAAKVEAAPRVVREIAWKAQTRLSARYRHLVRKGKLKTVAVTAVARELSGFIWSINRALLEKGEAGLKARAPGAGAGVGRCATPTSSAPHTGAGRG